MSAILGRTLFKSKIHRARVTHADANYEGSLTVDAELLERADILPYEEVHVWNVTRGSRLVTYALPGERGSGVVCTNGAAALLNSPGDIVIVATFAVVAEADARSHRPTVVFVDERNRAREDVTVEIPGPGRRGGAAVHTPPASALAR
ncbi:MAG: aspartate 1-decarboxylase [Pseudomonadota bacterium]